MALLTWEDKYKVGISKIDDQHKKIVELINKLYDSMAEGRGKDVLKSILNDLVEYTKYHFQTEEKYFEDYKYQNKNEHKKEHEDLKNKVTELKGKVDIGKAVLSTEIMQFLKQWLVNHIVESDKKYSTFLISQGVR